MTPLSCVTSFMTPLSWVTSFMTPLSWGVYSLLLKLVAIFVIIRFLLFFAFILDVSWIVSIRFLSIQVKLL